MGEAHKRYAVVTGSNKGIGFGTVQHLASHGLTVILTARNQQLGLDALQKIKELELKGEVLFHQLDVADQDSVNNFSDFIGNNFGKLDILVNNAGVLTGKPKDVNKIREIFNNPTAIQSETIPWGELWVETSESIDECFNINYHGTKRMCQAMIPFLQESDFPTIVNVSSYTGMLENIYNERAKTVLSNVETLTEKKIEELLREFIENAERGGASWTNCIDGHTLSKAAVNAYTRVLSRKYPFIRTNAVCPGIMRTDISYNSGVLSFEEGADSVSHLALCCNNCISGKFFIRKKETSF